MCTSVASVHGHYNPHYLYIYTEIQTGGSDHWLPLNRASCPPTNWDTNTGIVGRYGTIPNDYTLRYSDILDCMLQLV